MPPVGWLNDPNGFCEFNNEYHVFYQYSPFNAKGGIKFWGHYKSKDFINWESLDSKVYSDQPYDCHGAYSGSTLVHDGKMNIFYTGNVKNIGDYDYINSGREHNTVLIVSEDGKNFNNKKLLMKNRDRKSTRLNSSHVSISYAVFCLKKKKYYYKKFLFLLKIAFHLRWCRILITSFRQRFCIILISYLRSQSVAASYVRCCSEAHTM